MTAVDFKVAPRAGVQPLRPSRRPAVPLLTALDDDSETDGETLRLRTAALSIGRHAADWTFGNDLDMSGTHAKIVHCPEADQPDRWRLLDQGSSNGTFVRVARIELSHSETFMLGGVLLRWETGSTPRPRLHVFNPAGMSRVIRIANQSALTLGSDSSAADIAVDDSTVDARHATLQRHGSGWILEDLSSRNGIWQRVSEYPLSTSTHFMLGEQRFLFRLPEPPAMPRATP